MPAQYLKETGTIIGWTELPGEGPPVLCLPGLAIPGAPYLAPLFATASLRGRAAIIPDLPGVGMSDALTGKHAIADLTRAMAALLDHLDLQAVPVVGHSLGGSVAIEMARSRPELVSRLIVAEANVSPGGGGASRKVADCGEDDFVSSGFRAHQAERLAAAQAGDAFMAFLYAGRCTVDPRALSQTARGLVDLDPGLEADFLSMTIPRAFLYGERTVPKDAADVSPDTPDPAKLRANGIAIEVIPDAGHMMPYDAPEATAKAIAAHL